MVMDIAMGLVRWWYGEGFTKQLSSARERFASTVDFFSITLLLKTLFSPYKQISAGKVRGPIGIQLQAWLDRLVSRCVGAIFRSIMILSGIVALTFSIIFNTLRLGGWLLLPPLPAIGLVLTLIWWIA